MRRLGLLVLLAGVVSFVAGSFYGADHGGVFPLFSRVPTLEACSRQLVESLHRTPTHGDVRVIQEFVDERSAGRVVADGNLRLSQPFVGVHNTLDGVMDWGADKYRLYLRVQLVASRDGGSCSVVTVTEQGS
jgi:hypothetical protein